MGDDPPVPGAVRGPSGVWNEETLPVMEWEAAEHRVVLPCALQDALDFESPVLRWDREKYDLVVRTRLRDAHVVRSLTRYLDGWKYHGNEIDKHVGNRRVVFQDEESRWYAVTLGKLSGSEKVVTVIGGSDKGYLRNRLRGMRNVVEKEK